MSILKKKPTLVQRIKGRKLNDIDISIGIFFLTSELDRDNLEMIFGKPIVHKKFGEGGIKGGKYASYFPEINGKIIHIGYDHRGTSIEVKYGGDVFNYTEEQCDEYFEIVKVLVDKYRSLF